jgi:hypothetical protein
MRSMRYLGKNYSVGGTLQHDALRVAKVPADEVQEVPLNLMSMRGPAAVGSGKSRQNAAEPGTSRPSPAPSHDQVTPGDQMPSQSSFLGALWWFWLRFVG